MSEIKKENNGMKEVFIDSMNGILECVNGEGQVKDCEFDWEKMEVRFVFKLCKPEDVWTFIDY